MTSVFCFITIFFFFKTQKKYRLWVFNPHLLWTGTAHRHTKQYDFSFYIHFSIHFKWPPLKNSFLEPLLWALPLTWFQARSPGSLPLPSPVHSTSARFSFLFRHVSCSWVQKHFSSLSLLHGPPSSPHHFSFLIVEISFSFHGFPRPENRGNLNLVIMMTMKQTTFLKSRV